MPVMSKNSKKNWSKSALLIAGLSGLATTEAQIVVEGNDPGGSTISATGDFALALGQDATAANDNSFVFGGSSGGADSGADTATFWVDELYLGTKAIGDSIDNLETSVINLNNDIGTLEDDISSLESAVSSNTADIAVVTADVATNTADISALQSGFSTLQSQVSSNTNDISSLQSAVSSNDNDISSLQSAVSSIQSQVSSNDNDISSLQSQVSSNDADISSLQSQVSNNDADISQNAADIASLDALIAALQAQVNALHGITTAGPTTTPAPTTTPPAAYKYDVGVCGGIYCTITSATTCNTAATALGYTGDAANVVSKSAKVAGCYTTAAGNLVFNTDLASTEIHNTDNGQFVVCELCSGRRALRSSE